MNSPNKSQSQQKQISRNSGQRGSITRDDSQGQQSSGNKYYQSRYIYQQSPARSISNIQTPFQKRSGQKVQQSSQVLPPKAQIEPQQQQYDIPDQMLMQTPVQSQYTNARQRQDYNYQPSSDIDSYSQLKNEYIKLQQEFARKVSEQGERIQMLANQVAEKEDLLIREQKTRQLLESENQEYCRKLNDMTGDYHTKLQMKEEVFYQKGQECYNEINILKRTILELQQKLQDSDSYVQHQESEFLKLQDKNKLQIAEKEQIIGQKNNEIQQLRRNLDNCEGQNSVMSQQIEELKQQLYQGEIAKQGVEANLRQIIEEKNREQEAYELLLKQKEAEKCLEANDLISALNHFRDDRSEKNQKHKQWISVIQQQLKQLNQKKYDLIQQIYNQKNQWSNLVNITIAKMSDQIKMNAIWYRKLLKNKDIAIIKFQREKEKEINDLNYKWQTELEQQDRILHNEFQTEFLNQSGKFEAKLTELQGQLNDYNSNYLMKKEHNEVVQLKEMKWNEERDRLLKAIGELETIAEDLEWKLQKSEKEFGLSNNLLNNEIKIKSEIQLQLNDCEKRRISLELKLNNSEFLNSKLNNDIQDLILSLDTQIHKNEKDLDVKKKLEEQLLIRRIEIQGLEEEILQLKFQIQKNNNLINKRELELEQKDKELDQKENEILRLKKAINDQDARIRTMEINERNDLNEYHKNSKSNSDEIESLWKAKKELWRDLQDINYEHLKGFDKLHTQKKKVVDDLFAVTWQLRQRDRELKNEQRTVEALIANKKKLSSIIEDLNQKIDQLNDNIEELQLNLQKSKEEKNTIIQKFKEFKLSQLKQKKFQLVQTKKFMQELQKEYMQYSHEIDQEMKQSNSALQSFVIEIHANLRQLAIKQEDEKNELKIQLDTQHEENLNIQLANQKQMDNVQLENAKLQMNSQIVNLSEQVKILQKKLQNTGFNTNQLDQELFQSQNVMRFADQEIFDIKQRYKNIQGELDTILLDFKGQYEAIEQEHLNTEPSKLSIQQVNHFTAIQNVYSQFLGEISRLLAKYDQMNQQKDRDLKNSQMILQSKLLSSSKLMQSRSPKKIYNEPGNQLIESFSPTQMQQNRIQLDNENKNLFDIQKI